MASKPFDDVAMCYWVPLRAYPLIPIGSRPPAGKVDMYPQASGCLLAGEKSYNAWNKERNGSFQIQKDCSPEVKSGRTGSSNPIHRPHSATGRLKKK
ncbi:hypothetical protein SADUNF_Sadunf13G0009800 [Salix dunnii]|uniref:Uncharacterized protein n=1 Tax=Salix dunnii TaxID=1413687 RepID=A0A835JJQ5_9ROSI|nr:hypothetical protein SADUNF_Sadunf13G0009800 [Salix dunnii]